MYETFRDEMIYKLHGIDKSETALTVIGEDHFVEAVFIYMTVRKTDGLSNGTLEHIGRILRHTMATQALRGGTPESSWCSACPVTMIYRQQ